MTSDFDRFRIWARIRSGSWFVLLGVALANLAVFFYAPQHFDQFRQILYGALGVCLFCSLMTRLTSRCPHCGRSVFPFFGSRRKFRSIHRHRVVICAHCGREVETD